MYPMELALAQLSPILVYGLLETTAKYGLSTVREGGGVDTLMGCGQMPVCARR
jgi:hypothetical protein